MTHRLTQNTTVLISFEQMELARRGDRKLRSPTLRDNSLADGAPSISMTWLAKLYSRTDSESCRGHTHTHRTFRRHHNGHHHRHQTATRTVLSMSLLHTISGGASILFTDWDGKSTEGKPRHSKNKQAAHDLWGSTGFKMPIHAHFQRAVL